MMVLNGTDTLLLLSDEMGLGNTRAKSQRFNFTMGVSFLLHVSRSCALTSYGMVIRNAFLLEDMYGGPRHGVDQYVAE